MNPVARLFIIAGAILVGIGLLWQLGSRLPGGIPFGRLPGDISIRRENFQFYFPLTTSVLLSVVLTAILWLVRFFKR